MDKIHRNKPGESCYSGSFVTELLHVHNSLSKHKKVRNLSQNNYNPKTRFPEK